MRIQGRQCTFHMYGFSSRALIILSTLSFCWSQSVDADHRGFESSVTCRGSPGQDQTCRIRNAYLQVHKSTIVLLVLENAKLPKISLTGSGVADEGYWYLKTVRFRSKQELEHYALAMSPRRVPQLSLIMDLIWTTNWAHAMWDGLWPAFVGLAKFGEENEPFNVISRQLDSLDFYRYKGVNCSVLENEARFMPCAVFQSFRRFALNNDTSGIFQWITPASRDWMLMEHIVVGSQGSGEYTAVDALPGTPASLETARSPSKDLLRVFVNRMYRTNGVPELESGKKRSNQGIKGRKLKVLVTDNKRYTQRQKSQLTDYVSHDKGSADLVRDRKVDPPPGPVKDHSSKALIWDAKGDKHSSWLEVSEISDGSMSLVAHRGNTTVLLQVSRSTKQVGLSVQEASSSDSGDGSGSKQEPVDMLNEHEDVEAYYSSGSEQYTVDMLNKRDDVEAYYVDWGSYMPLARQFHVIRNADVHVTSTGTATFFSLFLPDGAVHVDLGYRATISNWGNCRGTCTFPSWGEESLLSGNSRVKVIFRNATSIMKDGNLSDEVNLLVDEAVSEIKKGFPIPLPDPRENLSPVGKVIFELTRLDPKSYEGLHGFSESDHGFACHQRPNGQMDPAPVVFGILNSSVCDVNLPLLDKLRNSMLGHDLKPYCRPL
eukprot:TRINITY_DN14838_c2_g1_i1.p1 TRINITY_DN14838_c2_g1~~TRINITY_DN14838_c2_g1_i1.p1  ORF type:complete len:657 (+),score=73.02 TRINITY_DN14838_c2_g1_i1:58-2028(+)